MMDWPQALRVLLTWTALAGLAWVLFAIVRSVRRGGKPMHAIGAALMLFGWGNLRDPGDNPVAEAKDGRIRRDEYSGDPLDPNSDSDPDCD
jgi:hypothetical protein